GRGAGDPHVAGVPAGLGGAVAVDDHQGGQPVEEALHDAGGEGGAAGEQDGQVAEVPPLGVGLEGGGQRGGEGVAHQHQVGDLLVGGQLPGGGGVEVRAGGGDDG